MVTFGNQNEEDANLSIIDSINVGKFSPSSDGIVTEMWAFVLVTDVNKKLKTAIYSHDAGQNLPLSPIKLSGEITVIANALPQWVKTTLVSELEVTNGTQYWLAAWCESQNGDGVIKYHDYNTGRNSVDPQAYGAWPDPHVSAFASDWTLSIWAYGEDVIIGGVGGAKPPIMELLLAGVLD